MSADLGYLDQDLRGIVNESDAYTVVSATASQMDFGLPDLVPSVEITYMVPGRDGMYTVELPISGWRVFESGLDLSSEAAIVQALWSL